jgi:hypothetical protein
LPTNSPRSIGLITAASSSNAVNRQIVVEFQLLADPLDPVGPGWMIDDGMVTEP